ncbi:DUF3617 domain-containing protein [Allosphingosinicella sp.]|uniref:DUF3617 domain-containing protein n=1 Tax=Allosphingosinicella sp. TaxID=2823234 RepID=UPI002FC0B7BF
MSSFNGWGRAAIALGAVALLTAPALTQSGGKLAALARLEPGLWQLRDLDSDERYPPICVADPAILMQLQHRNSPCSRLVISGDARSATVHYTCPASGFGRTSLRVETPRLAQIDTQGISDNAPFAYRIEARRAGPCPSGKSQAGR